MQRIGRFAVGRGLGSLVCTAGIRASTRSKPPPVHWRRAGVGARPARPFTAETGQRLCRRRFAGDRHRLFSSQPGTDGPPRNRGHQPGISVVGIPDPVTWIQCKITMYLINLCFEVDVNSVEFERGVKQALVYVSSKMSSGRYHELRGIVSHETVDYVEEKCKSLTTAQRKQLAVKMEDIIFVLPEDITVVFDKSDRKFCFVVMRFWFLSSYEGPDDPEATKIFKVASGEGGDPHKRIATAVYEFQRELTMGAYPDWKVTTVWHWHWKLAGVI
ncbi:m-AAA protease-interacting protein 1, mitochondrial isoform X1 [Parambassis ranga]|uniref:M-AAA protease-interacting protein 1, mitochondrial isoform X1 n=1 Tax=Parambassis ranga TaxID=210632 RepID=A0A6P7JWQ4_9TELE|nr:m-AAA protease-interacting protein 1, mitochondrial-like isoform X1 [Parambassis ranga]